MKGGSIKGSLKKLGNKLRQSLRKLKSKW
jgi:hypothetical protein